MFQGLLAQSGAPWPTLSGPAKPRTPVRIRTPPPGSRQRCLGSCHGIFARTRREGSHPSDGTTLMTPHLWCLAMEKFRLSDTQVRGPASPFLVSEASSKHRRVDFLPLTLPRYSAQFGSSGADNTAASTTTSTEPTALMGERPQPCSLISGSPDRSSSSHREWTSNRGPVSAPPAHDPGAPTRWHVTLERLRRARPNIVRVLPAGLGGLAGQYVNTWIVRTRNLERRRH